MNIQKYNRLIKQNPIYLSNLIENIKQDSEEEYEFLDQDGTPITQEQYENLLKCDNINNLNVVLFY